MHRIAAANVIETLLAHDGEPPPLPARRPFEWILGENVAYLADDDRRARAFVKLEETIGATPERILAASNEGLLAVARYGIVPDQTVAKLRKIARLALMDFQDGIESVLTLPESAAVRALRAHLLLRRHG